MKIKNKNRERMDALITQIQEALFLGDDYTPFLNKYHLEIDIQLAMSRDIDDILYNESILVLDKPGPYNEKPFILGMNRVQLTMLTAYFGAEPIHKTNRIALHKTDGFSQNQKYMSLFQKLISDEIKPQLLVTFSASTGKIIRDNFELNLEKTVDGTGLWSGFIKIGSKYFFIYCLPDISESDIHSDEISNFIMATRVYEFQTSFHINEILKIDPALNFPENPLGNAAVKNAILRVRALNNKTYLGNSSDIAGSIKDFDAYDLIFARSPLKIGLSNAEYIEMRKKESSKDICLKFINESDLSYQYNSLTLMLVRLYLYTNYPQESFDADWKNSINKAKTIIDNYNDSLEAFNKLKKEL